MENNFKFTESARTRENREAVKRDNNNVYDFLESEGYNPSESGRVHQFKGLLRDLPDEVRGEYLTALKPRSFSDALVSASGKYNLEYCNNIINAAGRRVRGFYGIEALVMPHINEF